MNKKSLSMLLILFFIGCANSPQENKQKLTFGTVQQNVKKGANQTDVMRSLGAPNIISKDKNGLETWTYDKISRESGTSSRSLGLFGGIGQFLLGGSGSKSSSSVSSKSITVIITFDNDKNITDFSYQSLEF
tara:strand:+ start:1045 stop:1440 length:396 start_codon:yes stop_codon:yes gene_type:complete